MLISSFLILGKIFKLINVFVKTIFCLVALGLRCCVGSSPVVLYRLPAAEHSMGAWVQCRGCCSVSPVRLCDPMDCGTPGFPVLHHLLEFAQTLVHWISDAIQPSHPLPSFSPPAFNLSQHQGLFRWVPLCIRWPKYLNFSFSINLSNWYSGLISFRINWFDLLAVQGTLKSLLQHHSTKSSILQWSAFFMVQFSHLYMTTGKIIALTIWPFVGKVMSLLFDMLSRP